jgi:hypothetical protein
MYILTKQGKLSEQMKAFIRRVITAEIKGDTIKLYPVELKGRFANYRHYSFTQYAYGKFALSELGVGFEEKNDAPRGGKLGIYFEFHHSEFFRNLLKLIDAAEAKTAERELLKLFIDRG